MLDCNAPLSDNFVRYSEQNKLFIVFYCIVWYCTLCLFHSTDTLSNMINLCELMHAMTSLYVTVNVKSLNSEVTICSLHIIVLA